MRCRFGIFAGVIGAGLLAASAASATPFTFQFNMPTWDYSNRPEFGTNAFLSLTVDNGGLNYNNQAYSFLDVTSATVAAQDGTFDSTWTASELVGKEDPGYIFLNTNALGIATLDLLSSPTQQALAVFNDGGQLLQFGLLEQNGVGNYPFTVVDTLFGDAAVVVGPKTCNTYCGIEVVDPNPPTGVPEPSSLPMLLAGLGMIGATIYFGRKKATARV
jgi:hypothetical protein